MLHWGTFSDPETLHHTVTELAEMGVLFLMFGVGLEVHLHELLSVGKVALWAGLLGALFPLVLALPAVMPFGYDLEAAIFVGVVLSATSVSISAQTLLELGILSTKEGIGLLAAAVVDDVLAILIFSISIALLSGDGGGSAGDIVWILARMMLYIGGAMAVAWFGLPRLFDWLDLRQELTAWPRSGFALVAASFSAVRRALGGVATITGAFIAGLGLSQTSERTKGEIVEAVRRVSYSLLVPIFFVNVGLQTDLTAIEPYLLPLAGLLLAAAVASKVIGSGLGAYIGGFDKGESFRLGVCMISRGEVA